MTSTQSKRKLPVPSGYRRVGCPVCGFTDDWPVKRTEKVWCAHTRRLLWGEGPHPDSPAATVWTEMVPVEVVRAN